MRISVSKSDTAEGVRKTDPEKSKEAQSAHGADEAFSIIRKGDYKHGILGL